MGFFTRIIVGGIVVIVGFGMIIKTNLVLEMLGTVSWAEQNFGPGGSKFFWKLVGFAVCLIGLMIMVNLGESLFMGTIGRLIFVGSPTK
jgi:hypothetical protein